MLRSISFPVLTVLCCFATFAADVKDPAALLQPNSVWQGQAEGDPLHAKSRVFPAHLKVLTRDGEKFTASYVVRFAAGPAALELEGRVKNGKIEAKVTKLIRGNFREDVMNILWTGEVKDEQMIIQRTNAKNVTTTTKLSLSKSKEVPDDPGDKPKGK